MCFYGVGNHGGEPTKKNIECIQRMDQDPSLPRIIFSSPELFFELDGSAIRQLTLDEETEAAEPEPKAAAAALGRRPWLDAEGKPLPFQDAESIERFLEEAEIVSWKYTKMGITRPKKLTLQRDGVTAHAVFHYMNEKKVDKTIGARRYLFWRDSYYGQVAGYRVSRLLGIDTVPPTVLRKVDNTSGSVQLWVENTMLERDRWRREIQPASRIHYQHQFDDMRVFDNVIGNIDRNQTNILIDEDSTLWLIDHTRAFMRDKRLPNPDFVKTCSRRLLSALRELDAAELKAALGDLLDSGEIKAILLRRDKLVELIEERVEKLGESAVLFDYGAPETAVTVIYENGENEPDLEAVPVEERAEEPVAAPAG